MSFKKKSLILSLIAFQIIISLQHIKNPQTHRIKRIYTMINSESQFDSIIDNKYRFGKISNHHHHPN